MKTRVILLVAVLVVCGGAYAADPPNPPTSPNPPGSTEADNAALEAQFEAARARLEEAAHEMAELSAQRSREVMEHMRTLDAELPPRAVMGVQLDPRSGKEGARIQDVSPGGPAADAGLHAGDVIVGINGKDVKGDSPARQVVHLLRDVAPDGKVKVHVLRDGQSRDFVVTARPGAPYISLHAYAHPPLPPIPPMPPRMTEGPDSDFMPSLPLMIHGPLGNMELVTLTPRLGHYFGVDKGVLVVRGPAEGGFKLEDGDVILSIDGREPSSGSHATRILSSYQPGEKVTMKIMRDHKTVNVETTLPERNGPRPPPDRKPRPMIEDRAPA